MLQVYTIIKGKLVSVSVFVQNTCDELTVDKMSIVGR